MLKLLEKTRFATAIALAILACGQFGPKAFAQPAAPAAGSPVAGSPDAAAATQATNPYTSEWLIGTAVSDANSPQYKDVADAITRFRNTDVNGAKELLTRARQNSTKLPPVEVMMGRLWAAAGQLGAARAELEKAVIAYPSDPDAYLYFAEASLGDRRVTDAEALLLEAKPLIAAYNENPKRKRNFDIRFNADMAAVNEARTQWQSALPYLQQWLALDQDNAAAHHRMGRTQFQLGKPTDAYNEFDAAMKIEPKMPNPYIALADLYEQNKDRPNAAKSISFAVQKYPKDLNVHLAAARWGMVTNQLNEAQKYAEAALKIEPKSLDAKIIRGEVARFTGDLAKAETLLQDAVAQAPANIEASNQLALVLADSNDAAKQNKALQLAELNLRATTQGDRANPEVAATYAWVLYKLGRTSEAEQILVKILSSGPISPDTAYYVGKILQDRGKTDEAIKVLEQALAAPTPFAQRAATSDLLNQLKKDKEKQPVGGDNK